MYKAWMQRWFAFLICFALVQGCSSPTDEVLPLKHYPIDHPSAIITKTDTVFDPQKSSDGNGSVRVLAGGVCTIRLFETGDLDVEGARLLYQARLSTEDLAGRTYLEMWCHFPDGGEYFSRGLQAALSGTNGWVTVETPFFLQKGQNPDNVKLNVVIEGPGTVWIDDIHLYLAPLN